MEYVIEPYAKVGAVRARVVLDQEGEGIAVEEARILGEQAEEDAHQEAFEVVTRVAAVLEHVMQFAKQFDGPDVDRVFDIELMLLVAGNEGEAIDAAIEFIERELGGLILFQIVQREAREIADDHVARDFVVAAFVFQRLNVIECLGLGFFQRFAPALVLDQEDALPEAIDVAPMAR